ncbi:MAG: hypothetical protein ACWGNK_00905 [Desulfobacterales bacterium]
MKSQTRCLIGMMLICLTICSCDTGAGWEGKYATSQPSDRTAGLTLILDAGGKGQWIIDQESTPLQWEERGGDVWLHFKTGGVIIAKSDSADQSLTVEIPGSDSVLLRKVH